MIVGLRAAADILGVTVGRISQLIGEGRIPFKKSGGIYTFTKTGLTGYKRKGNGGRKPGRNSENPT